MIITTRELHHAYTQARIQGRRVYCYIRDLQLGVRVESIGRDWVRAGVIPRRWKIDQVQRYWIA